MCQPVGSVPATAVDPPADPARSREEDRARRHDVRTSLRASVKDGVAWSYMNAAGDRYVAPFVILGGSSLWQVAAITALPIFGGAIMQLFSAAVTDKLGQRKRVFLNASRLQAALWLPIAIAILLPLSVGYWIMLVAFILAIAAHNFSAPPWFSAMGDLVPAARRGRYFGNRNFLCGLAVLVAFFGAGQWITFSSQHLDDLLPGLAGRTLGFFLLFLSAGVARAISVYYLSRMVDPPYHAPPDGRFSLLQFIRRMPQGQFGRFVIYMALLNGANATTVTYLSWYLLDGLGFTTAVFAGIMTTQLIASFASQPLWGRLADRVGNRRILALAGTATIAVPILLMGATTVSQFIAILFFDGLMLAAIGLAGFNFVFDIVTPAKRARCIAYASLFNACSATLGIFGGAFLATAVPHLAPLPWNWGLVTLEHPFSIILIALVIVRILPNAFILPTIREPRVNAAGAMRR